MFKIIIIVVLSIVSIITSILTIKAFNKIDDSVNIDTNKKDIIIISFLLLICGIISYKLDIIKQLVFMINSTYLAIQAYTDFKTKTVYSIINYIMIIINIVFAYLQFNYVTYNIEDNIQFKIFVSSIIVIITASIINGIGKGDMYVYLNILLVYIMISEIYSLLSLSIILISNLFFVIVGFIIHINNKKHINNKEALIPYIFISWIINSIIL